MDTPPLLQLTTVTKSFDAVQALRGVSFDLKPGEVHALVGENGAGKSTLIRLIAGAHEPDSGRICIHGQERFRLTPAQARALGVACIHQQPALFPDLSVAENMALRLEPRDGWRRVNRTKQRDRARALLERVGVVVAPDTEVRRLSMPEQQSVEIACALGAAARIVVMDEPTASLTRREQELLFQAVRELKQTGAGVVYISHRLEEILTLADRVTVLRDGRNVGTWPAAEVDEASLIHAMVGRSLTLSDPVPGAGPGEAMLSLRRVGCAAGRVREVSLEVRAGEIVGLAGLVGSGRTELARVIFGVTPADDGEIWLGGRRVTLNSPREAVAQGVAYVPEDRRRHGAILEMSLAANLTLAAHGRVFPGGWLRLGAERDLALEFMRRLSVVAAGPDAPVRSLSGGNQQKIALGRWLVAQPRLLILDEPTQGVDVGAKHEIHRWTRDLARSGMAVLMISSDLPEILELSDRIGVMRGGALVTVLPGRAPAAQVMRWALGQGEERP